MFRELPPRGPDGPRPLTPEMEADADRIGRVGRLVGPLLGVVFVPLAIACYLLAQRGLVPAFAVLGLAGLGAWAVGASLRADRRALLRHGEEARGEVSSIEVEAELDPRNPWLVRYRFEAHGVVHEGSQRYWADERPAGVEPGRALVVLYDRRAPWSNVLWSVAPDRTDDVETAEARTRIRDAWEDPYAAEADAEAEDDDAVARRAEEAERARRRRPPP